VFQLVSNDLVILMQFSVDDLITLVDWATKANVLPFPVNLALVNSGVGTIDSPNAEVKGLASRRRSYTPKPDVVYDVLEGLLESRVKFGVERSFQ
jgi:hypothetical protein